MITCAMCGHQFVPGGRNACQSCPLNPGCHLACCPNCGFENANPEHSSLVRLVRRWQTAGARFRKRQGLKIHHGPAKQDYQLYLSESSLAETRPGSRVCLQGYLPGLSQQQQTHLRAYGLTEGCYLTVVQRSPVIVVKVEHTELAIEQEVARGIRVSLPVS